MPSVSLRAQLTNEERKALKVLAVEKGLSLERLVTVALQTSPQTKKVFA